VKGQAGSNSDRQGATRYGASEKLITHARGSGDRYASGVARQIMEAQSVAHPPPRPPPPPPLAGNLPGRKPGIFSNCVAGCGSRSLARTREIGFDTACG